MYGQGELEKKSLAARVLGWFGYNVSSRTKTIEESQKRHEERTLIPHHRTFSGLAGILFKQYLQLHDEALKHSRENALAMRRDAFIYSLLRERLLPVANADWHVVPEDDKSPIAKAHADAMGAILKATPKFTKMRLALLEAVWYGRYGVQFTTRQEKVKGMGRTVVDRWYPVNGDKIIYHWDGTPAVVINPLTVDDYPETEIVIASNVGAKALRLADENWRNRFIIHQHEINDADYWEVELAGQVGGVGLRNYAYWLWWLREEMMSWVVDLMQKVGTQGLLIFWYPEGNATAKAKAEQAALEASEGFAFAMPRGTEGKDQYEVQHITITTNAVDVIEKAIDTYCNTKLERLIIGQDLSGGSGPTGLGSGLAALHADTKYQLLSFDANNLAETLTVDMLRTFTRWNFPKFTGRLDFEIQLEKPGVGEKIQSIVSLAGLGVEFDADKTRAIVGEPKPELGAKTIGGQQQQQPMGGSVPMGQAPDGDELDEDSDFDADMYSLDEIAVLYADEDTEPDKGRWVTIHGVHVFINKAGNVTKGPRSLIGEHHQSITPEHVADANNPRKRLDDAHAAGHGTTVRNLADKAKVSKNVAAAYLKAKAEGREYTPSRQQSVGVSQEDRQQLLDQAIQEGGEGQSVRELAKKAGVSRTAAHRTVGGMGRRPDGTPKAPQNQDVYTVNPRSLKVDPQRFQYKISGIGNDGVTDELKGTSTWNPNLGGVLLVWRDPQDGQDYVVNGHHRHELAQRTGTDSINVRYIDAGDHKVARSMGALANIAEGRGTATDAAKFMRDTGTGADEMAKMGVSLKGKVMADANHLKNLSPEAFNKLAQGRLEEAHAVPVARQIPDDHEKQNLMFRLLDKREDEGKSWSTREIEQAARKMANSGSHTTVENTLFGDVEEEKSTFEQEVELESHINQVLSKRHANWSAVSSQKRADQVSEAGNVLQVDENARRRDEAAVHSDIFSRESMLKGDISGKVKEHAARLAEAKTKGERDAIKKQLESEIQPIIERIAGGGQPAQTDTGAESRTVPENAPIAANASEQPAASGTNGQPGQPAVAPAGTQTPANKLDLIRRTISSTSSAYGNSTFRSTGKYPHELPFDEFAKAVDPYNTKFQAGADVGEQQLEWVKQAIIHHPESVHMANLEMYADKEPSILNELKERQEKQSQQNKTAPAESVPQGQPQADESDDLDFGIEAMTAPTGGVQYPDNYDPANHIDSGPADGHGITHPWSIRQINHTIESLQNKGAPQSQIDAWQKRLQEAHKRAGTSENSPELQKPGEKEYTGDPATTEGRTKHSNLPVPQGQGVTTGVESAPTESTPQEAKAKEPHEMTKDQFRNDLIERDGLQRARDPHGVIDSMIQGAEDEIAKGERFLRNAKNSTEAKKIQDTIDWHKRRLVDISHKHNVESALAAGKTVPPEVLADYPDLQQKYAPTDATEPEPAAPEPFLPSQRNMFEEQQGNLFEVEAGDGSRRETKPEPTGDSKPKRRADEGMFEDPGLFDGGAAEQEPEQPKQPAKPAPAPQPTEAPKPAKKVPGHLRHLQPKPQDKVE